MDDSEELRIRWLCLGTKTREVYSLPNNVPWPEDAPPPSTEDYFLNISALGAAVNSQGGEWEALGEFCHLCEQAGEAMENFDYNQALLLLDGAEGFHRCAFVHWQRCICHLELRQGEQALAAAYHSASMAPKCGVFWRVYGELCLERGLVKEGEAAFERAFFGGEHSPSVISAMRGAGLLVPAPGADGEMLVSPAVASAVFKTHISGLVERRGGEPRLRELVKAALEYKTTAGAALNAAKHLYTIKNRSLGDELLYAEALAKAGETKPALRILRTISSRESPEILASEATRVLRVLECTGLRDFDDLPRELLTAGGISRDSTRMIFERWDAQTLQTYAQNKKSGLALVVAAEKLLKDGERDRAVECSELASIIDSEHETKVEAAKVLLEAGEYEKVCAALSRIDSSMRGAEGCFLFGEALWRMGVEDQAAGHFDEALRLSGNDRNDGLFHNSQMRVAQCGGFLQLLPEPTTLSPTRRLGRSLSVSNDYWSSVIAPAGLPSSSYVRIRIEREVEACTYQVAELSRVSGKIVIGEFVPKGRHDELCLAIEPSGRIFIGAKYRGDWVEVDRNSG